MVALTRVFSVFAALLTAFFCKAQQGFYIGAAALAQAGVGYRGSENKEVMFVPNAACTQYGLPIGYMFTQNVGIASGVFRSVTDLACSYLGKPDLEAYQQVSAVDVGLALRLQSNNPFGAARGWGEFGTYFAFPYAQWLQFYRPYREKYPSPPEYQGYTVRDLKSVWLRPYLAIGFQARLGDRMRLNFGWELAFAMLSPNREGGKIQSPNILLPGFRLALLYLPGEPGTGRSRKGETGYR